MGENTKLPEGLVLFGEEDFKEQMETTVRRWEDIHMQSGDLTVSDGTVLRYHYAIHPQEKGAITVVHGFCEFYAKYLELLYVFYQMGYSVFFYDQRGYGYSTRKNDQPDMVYVDSFDEYVQDLKTFQSEIVFPKAESQNCILFAHSMGGCIAGLFLEQYPGFFKKAVLSAPMMEINYGGTPLWQVKMMAALTPLFGLNKYAPGQKPFDGKSHYPDCASASEARYLYQLEWRNSDSHYTTNGGSFAWARAAYRATKRVIKEADRCTLPVLMFTAGKDTFVMPSGHDAFAEKAANVQRVFILDAKHEFFMDHLPVRQQFYSEIYRFLEA